MKASSAQSQRAATSMKSDSVRWRVLLSLLFDESSTVGARIAERPLSFQQDIALAWKQFLFAIPRRTPESQERISPTKLGPEDVFYQAALQGTNGDNLPLPAKESFYGSPRVAELQKMVMSNINARFAAGDHPRLASETAKFCAETGLCIAYCPYTEEKLRHWKPWPGYCRIRT